MPTPIPDAADRPVFTLEAALEHCRGLRAAAAPDQFHALDHEISRLERALEAIWRR